MSIRAFDEPADNALVLEKALDADLGSIVTLMNAAYRGRDGGWNSEADYIDGDRTTEIQLRTELSTRVRASLLVCRTPGLDGLLGCVWLEPEDDGVWYLGSLTVDPREQNGGLGRKLLAASEEWVRRNGGQAIRMTVVNVRDTLIGWYQRRGYILTAEREPFPYDDDRFGIPRRPDLEFVVLRKRLH